MATRGLSATNKTEIAKSAITIGAMVKLEFDSGDVTLWSGNRTLPWSGDDYLGAGQLLGVSKSVETIGGVATNASVSLSGIPSNLLSLALTEGTTCHGRTGTIYFGLFNISTLSLIADPFIYFQGFMDHMRITGDSKSRTIVVTLEHYEIRKRVIEEVRYTNSEQLSRFPDDEAFKFIAAQTNTSEYWGNVAPV